jgi:hypothetical protein
VESGSTDVLEDIQFFPGLECIRKLKNHRLIFKSVAGGFNIYYQSNPQALEPVVSPISKRTRFSFGFQISNSSFFKKYEPDFNDNPQLYFDNLSNTGAILTGNTEVLSRSTEVESHDAVKIYPLTFIVKTDLTVAAPPTEYQINEFLNPGNNLQTVAIENSLGLNALNTKLNDPVGQEASYISKSGPYVLETDSGQPPPATIYLDNKWAKKDVTGIVDIYWENFQSNAATNGNEYQMRFKLR